MPFLVEFNSSDNNSYLYVKDHKVIKKTYDAIHASNNPKFLRALWVGEYIIDVSDIQDYTLVPVKEITHLL